MNIKKDKLKTYSNILLDSENNSLILSFNYHKLLAMNIIWFNELDNIKFSKDLYENFKFLGIKEVKITEKISNFIKYKEYINIRNEYRDNKFE